MLGLKTTRWQHSAGQRRHQEQENGNAKKVNKDATTQYGNNGV